MATETPQGDSSANEDTQTLLELPIGMSRVVQERKITLRPSGAALLRISAELAVQRQRDKGLVSLSTFFRSGAAFRAQPLGIRIGDFADDAENAPIDRFQAALRSVSEEEWQAFNESVFSQATITVPSLGKSPAEAVPTSSVLAAMNTLSGQTVGAVDLLRAILANPSESLISDISILGLKHDDLLDALGDPDTDIDPGPAEAEADAITGFSMRLQREASADLALDRDSFALSLARLFRLAEGEFSLALLGRWGSGKTTVADRVKTLLTRQDDYEKAFDGTFAGTSKDSPEKRPIDYAVVDFNAWRYRRKPELWIWLYESFVATYLDANFAIRTVRTVRAGLTKHGLIPSALTLAALAFVMQPFLWLALVVPYGIAVFGFGGVIGLIFLARRAHGSLRDLLDRYGVVTSHRAHLGMQALVGEDLKMLVRAWTKPKEPKQTERAVFLAILAVVTLGWLYSLWTQAQPNTPEILKTVAAALGIEAPAGAAFGTPVTLVAFVIWAGLALLFATAALTHIGRTDRILLVVDDLDRCPQDEIVDLIDGIKLMIDDDEVGRAVQAFVLADDTILEAAIKARFAALSDAEGLSDQEQQRWRAAIREHMEKVFLCHVSLPALDGDDVGALVDHFEKEFLVASEGPSKTAAPRQSGPSQDPTSDPQRAADASGLTTPLLGPNEDAEALREAWEATGQAPLNVAQNASPQSREASQPEMAAVFTSQEMQAIRNALETAFYADASSGAVTPRTVRSFLFRYQLARMLLQANGQRYDPAGLASALADAVTEARDAGRAAAASPKEAEVNAVRWIAHLVA